MQSAQIGNRDVGMRSVGIDISFSGQDKLSSKWSDNMRDRCEVGSAFRTTMFCKRTMDG